MARVALYLGDSLPPNLVRLLTGFGAVIADEHQLVVVGSGVDPSPLPERYEYVDVPGYDADRGVTRLLATYRRASDYLASTPTPPDAIWQITAPQFHAVPVLLAGRRHGVPVATRIPGNKFDEYALQPTTGGTAKTFLLNNVALRTLRFSTVVVTLSEYNARAVTSRGIPADRVRLLRPPLDTGTFRPPNEGQQSALRDELDFDEDAWCALYVGRLSELKGIDDLETVVRRFEGDPDYEFHFAGTGAYESRLAGYDNTVVHGYVDPDRIPRYYRAADVHVHPSRVEEGGISWTMREAAATGLPVVARDVGDAADLASFVFTDTAELIAYLESPADWRPATYPAKWTYDRLAPEYDRFVRGLATRGRR